MYLQSNLDFSYWMKVKALKSSNTYRRNYQENVLFVGQDLMKIP